jgi:AraC family transcriptional regulator, regulatory protein of adaptative response / DNA-3-methyladenine glycosylase II
MESGTSIERLATRALSRAESSSLRGPVDANLPGDRTLDPGICWQALRSRDHRFDGRFFPGVLTTRVYCRTTCPVPLRKSENIRWFSSAAFAEAAGFRPCRRCNPHISPGAPAWLGTAAVVSRALKLIIDGGLDADNVDALADRVGIGARHLRRLFVQHLGASPAKIAQTRRVHFAGILIEETNLPITDIAFRSGFRSIRQFNQVMRAAFDISPSKLRRLHSSGSSQGQEGGIVIYLSYRAPLDWSALIGFLAPRATPGVEKIDRDRYLRTIEVGGDIGRIEVGPDDGRPRLRVRVKLKRYRHLVEVVERVRRLFDLFADPIQIADRLSTDSRLRGLVKARLGMRVPGAWDGFEEVVKVLLGDSFMTPGPIEPLARLVQAFGRPTPSTGELSHLFPSPKILAQADLSRAGINDVAAAAIRELATSVCQKQIRFDAFDTRGMLRRLVEIPGIDQSKADYIAMRAFGEPDAFPISDHNLHGPIRVPAGTLSGGEFLRVSESWRPWRAYAAMHLS